MPTEDPDASESASPSIEEQSSTKGNAGSNAGASSKPKSAPNSQNIGEAPIPGRVVALGVVALVTGLWAVHTFQLSNAKSDYDKQIDREERHAQRNLEQERASHGSLLESSRKEADTKLTATVSAHDSKVRELELTHQATITQVEEKLRRLKEDSERTIDSLRQKLATSRSSLEISTAGDFISVNQLLIDEQSARERLAEESTINIRRLLLPDYATLGWDRVDNVSLAQIESFVTDQTLKFRPDDVSDTDSMWQPLITLWNKRAKGSVAVVGAAELHKKELLDFLQKSSETTSTITTTNEDGTQNVRTEKTTLSPEKLAEIPIGISAYHFVVMLLSSNSQDDPASFSISEFSARSDALHFAMRIDIKSGEKYDMELLVLQDAQDTFLLFNVHGTENALDPVSKEAIDWLRQVRIVRKGPS